MQLVVPELSLKRLQCRCHATITESFVLQIGKQTFLGGQKLLLAPKNDVAVVVGLMYRRVGGVLCATTV